MMIKIPALLSADDLIFCRRALQDARWQNGRETAGHQAIGVKHNQQVALDDPIAQQLGQLILERLGQSPLFIASALPLRVLPPRFNRYEGGGTYGDHIDNALFPMPNSDQYLRTDLSCTLFLSDPQDYDGGELMMAHPDHEVAVKWDAGDMVLYPSTSLHRVNPVTKGTRLAAFFWVQSLVRQPDQRQILFDLDQSIQQVSQDMPDHHTLPRLTGVYHNLLRQWSQC